MALTVYSTATRHQVLPPSAVAILGEYVEDGVNHGRPSYKRQSAKGSGRLPPVFLFYWDERNGKEMMGWWFGSAVGSGKVWARSLDKTSAQPPKGGWKCPIDGAVQRHVHCIIQNVKRPAPVPVEGAAIHTPPAKSRKFSASCSLVAALHNSGEKLPPTTEVLLGEYQPVMGGNHDRRIFVKKASGRFGQVWLYYWDNRDGDELSGWWLGERVGGENVYARAQQHGPFPPRSGWRVPHDADVHMDFSLTPTGSSGNIDPKQRLEDAKKEVDKAEAAVDKAVALSQQVCSADAADVLEESIEAVRERLTSDRSGLMSSKATVEGHVEECSMLRENPVEAEFSVLQERLDAAIGTLNSELLKADKLAAAVAALQVQSLERQTQEEAAAIPQPQTPPFRGKVDNDFDGLEEAELTLDFAVEGEEEAPVVKEQETEQETAEIASLRRLLKPARESATKAKKWLNKLEELSAPWADSKEVVSEAVAEPFLDACDALLAEATPALQLSCTFLRQQVAEARELPFGPSQLEVLDEMACHMRSVEQAYFKVLEFKVKAGQWRIVQRIPEVVKKVVEAEEKLRGLEKSASLLFQDSLDKPELHDGLARACSDSLAGEDMCKQACASARQAVKAKQEDPAAKASPAFGSCLTAFMTRLQDAEAKVQSIKEAAESIGVARTSLAAKKHELALVDKAVSDVELLTIPMGDERLSEDAEDAKAKAVKKAQDAFAAWMNAAEEAASTAKCPALSLALRRLQDDSCIAIKDRLTEVFETTQEWLPNALNRLLAKEVAATLEKAEAAVSRLAAAEAPFLKGLEVLSGQFAEETFKACSTAEQDVQEAVDQASALLKAKADEVRIYITGDARDTPASGTLPQQGALAECQGRLQALTTRLEGFKDDMLQRKALAS